METEAGIIDPSSLYTLDDYLVQKDMVDAFAKEIITEVKESLEDQVAVVRGIMWTGHAKQPLHSWYETISAIILCTLPKYFVEDFG
jgi:hypothetical protein